MQNLDNLGKTCGICEQGTYEEQSVHDDLDGVLHCTSCGTQINRLIKDDQAAELEFLRFFYNKMKELMADAGTDEVYWVTEMYEEETGNLAPPPYGYSDE